MGRKKKSRDLYVAMNGRAVGTLTRLGHGDLQFAYDPAWIEDEIATPISLSLPLSTEPYAGARVASFFDNLLPDNDDIRRRMQVALDAESIEPFDLLSAAGADCVGALQLHASTERKDVRQVDAKRVSDAKIAAILRGYESHPLGMTPEDDDFRISIAGAQEKTAFLRHQGRWKRPRGTTPTTHLFKLPIGQLRNNLDLHDSVENEWLALELMKGFDVPVAAAEIRRFEDVKVLVVERFDRRWSSDDEWIIRLPQEDMCQALGVSPARKYESQGGPGMVAVSGLLQQSLSLEDRATFLRAQVVFWLLAAPDGHAKNFSVFLHPGGRFRMTPLYDVLSVHPLVARKQLAAEKVKMAMAVVGKNRHYHVKEIQRRHWLSTAEACRFPLPEMEAILDDCASRIDRAIEDASRALPESFPKSVSEPMFDGLAKMQPRLG